MGAKPLPVEEQATRRSAASDSTGEYLRRCQAEELQTLELLIAAGENLEKSLKESALRLTVLALADTRTRRSLPSRARPDLTRLLKKVSTLNSKLKS